MFMVGWNLEAQHRIKIKLPKAKRITTQISFINIETNHELGTEISYYDLKCHQVAGRGFFKMLVGGTPWRSTNNPVKM
jgi:hypothetical protein